MQSVKEAPSANESNVTFKVLTDYEAPKVVLPQSGEYYRYVPKTAEEVDKHVEYDMDEEDFAWLELMNERRAKENHCVISEDLFELAMDRFEKESFFQCESLALDSLKSVAVDEDALCSVCGSGDSEPDNTILFCDLCNIAVHQFCYGIPRVPAGPWACRRCTLSPSRAVECCLCPNGSDGCAMKPTEDGRWAHVSCALWIPEVGFACASVREPVNGISRVAAARWKLTCFVCSRRGNGACLQCRRTSCYTAFHVSCAIRAGLCSGLPSGDDEGAAVFCDEHSVPAVSVAEAQRRLSATRKALGNLHNVGPPLSIPVITAHSLAKIKERVALDKKDPFVGRLHCYWTLKRKSRNGAPLLRSMRYSMAHLARQRLQVPQVGDVMLSESNQGLDTSGSGVAETEVEEMVEQLKCWKRLRQDLEKVRLLLELIRKRERLKNEMIKSDMKLLELRLQPLVTVLSRMLDELYRLDCDGVLSSEPVKISKSNARPLTLTALRDRVSSHRYMTVDEFSEELEHLLDSLPSSSTVLREKALAMIAVARKSVDHANYDKVTGTHKKESTAESTVLERSFGNPGSVVTERSRVRSNSRSVSGMSSAETPTVPAPTTGGSGRPRGRPKKRPLDETAPNISPVSESRKSGTTPSTQPISAEQIKASSVVSARSSIVPPTPAGVNRRTAVLFGNKRRPGRPPKVIHNEPAANAVSDGDKPSKSVVSSALGAVGGQPENTASIEQKNDDVPVKRKRGRKKRVANEPGTDEAAFSPGSRWTERAAAIGGMEWGSGSGSKSDEARESSKSSGTLAKESFRQYRDMHDSDTEKARKVEKDEVASSSSSEESSGSSQSDNDDDDDDDDESSCSSDSDDDGTSNKRGGDSTRHSKSRNITARLSSLDLVWAKCSGFPWYPAQVIDPDITHSNRGDANHAIPVPPADILKSRLKSASDMFLVTFFDPKRTWKWLPRNKLDPLGTDPQLDRICLAANNKPNVCSAVKRAYDRAIVQRNAINTAGSENASGGGGSID